MEHGIIEKGKPCWSPCVCVGCTTTVGCWRSEAPGTPLHPSGPPAPPQPGGSGRTYCHLGLAASCNRHPEQRRKFSCRFIMLCVTFAFFLNTAKICFFLKSQTLFPFWMQIVSLHFTVFVNWFSSEFSLCHIKLSLFYFRQTKFMEVKVKKDELIGLNK